MGKKNLKKGKARKEKATFAVKTINKSRHPRHAHKHKAGNANKPSAGGLAVKTSQQKRDPKQELFRKEKRTENDVLDKKQRREKVRAMKMKKNKNYGVILEITTIWEKLRPRDVSEATKKKLMDLAIKRVKGRIPEIVRNPKASRVLQCCLQHGSIEDRQQILNEIHQGMATLSMSKYGKHLVQRVISKTPREDFHKVFRMFPAHCTRLLKHQYGSDVMNELYCKSSELEKHELTMVCYGREFHAALVDDWSKEYERTKATGKDPTSLETVFEDLDPIRRAGVLEKLHRLLSAIIEKGLLVNRLVHRLILEFFQSAPAAHVEDLCKTLVDSGDGLLKMVHTREGAAVAAAVLHYSDSSHRKLALRPFKDYVKETALDEWGYVFILKAFRVVDDTKMLRKTLLDGITANLEEICTSRYGRCIILDLLHPECSWYLAQKVETHLCPRTLEVSKEDSGDVRIVGLSKKDTLTRRTELLSPGNGSLVDALLDLCASKTVSLLKCRRGSAVLIEVARGGEDGLLDEEAVHKVVECIVEACVEDKTLLTDRVSKGAIMQLVHLAEKEEHRHAEHFCRLLWKKVFDGRCVEWMRSSQCSVLAALMNCGPKPVCTESRKQLGDLLEDQTPEQWLNSIKESKIQKRNNTIHKRMGNKPNPAVH